MTTVGATIRAVLIADATLTGQVAQRIFPDSIPQSTSYPCIAYTVIGTDPTNTKEGASQLDNLRIQFDIYSQSYDTSATISERVRTLLDNYKSGSVDLIYFEDERSGDYVADLGVFWISQTYEVQLKR